MFGSEFVSGMQKIWPMSMSLECSCLASEYVLGLGVLKFGK